MPRNEHPDPNLVGWPKPAAVADRTPWPPGYTMRMVAPGWADLVRLQKHDERSVR